MKLQSKNIAIFRKNHIWKMFALSDYWTSLIRSLTISISFINCKSSRHKLIFYIIYSKPYSMVIKGQTKFAIKGTCLMCIACSPLSYRCLFHFIVHHRTAGSLFATHKGIIFPPSKGKRKNISFELLHPSLLLPRFPFFFPSSSSWFSFSAAIVHPFW